MQFVVVCYTGQTSTSQQLMSIALRGLHLLKFTTLACYNLDIHEPILTLIKQEVLPHDTFKTFKPGFINSDYL